MNTKKNLSILLAAIIGIGTSFLFEKPLDSREKFSKFLHEHPFNNRPHFESDGDEEEDQTDRPDLAAEQDFMRTLNPSLGRPTPEVLPGIMKQIHQTPTRVTMSTPGTATSPWVERGPSNVGGRTRAIVWDPNDATGKKVWAAGVTGGLWYNNDITSATSSWVAVNNFWANITVSCIAFDPVNSQIAYVGTGEGFTSGGGNFHSSGIGQGIWKTSDGGATWTQLPSSSVFYYVTDIAVRNESGTSIVYAAVNGGSVNGTFLGSSVAGLQRSINGGASWTQVLPNVPTKSSNYVAADIEIGANNRIWIGTKSNPYGFGSGVIMYSDNGTSWTTSNTTSVASGGRVELACAPSNANTVYAIVEDGTTVGTMLSTTNGGTSWSAISIPTDADSGIPSTDFSRGQAWYDLIMAVDPNNANNVLVGAIDLFYSTNGGSSWSQISQWYNFGAGCSVVHSDQHAIVFKPGSSSSVVFGNDGGVHYTSTLSTAASSTTAITSRNKDYNVTQFYACAIHPTASSNTFLAGAQDNGTQRFTTAGINATTEASGGDGAFCFIDQVNPNYQIASYVYNSYYLSTNGGVGNFNTTLSADQSTGRFINPSAYDNNLHILYSCKSTSSIWRIKNINTTPTSPQSVSISGMVDYVSNIHVSPYTTTSSTLFVGTEAGKLFKVTGAENTPTTTDITGASFPAGSISCIEIGASENELLVTFFNYGVVSVWYTSNGGTTWVSKEGNLPDMPVRWALFNPLNRNEVLLATELGIWSSTNLNVASPTWATANNGMANVRVDMLQIRSSDNMVIAATHGRGLFSSAGFTMSSPPVAAYNLSTQIPCINETVTMTDLSSNTPNSWLWSISPSTYTFVGGTTATSQNPQIQFTAAGLYNITLTATNPSGSNSVTINNVLLAGGFQLPFTENWESSSTYGFWKIDNPDAPDTTWSIFSVAGNGSSTLAAGVNNYDYSTAGTAIKRDGLISPAIRLSGYSSASLTFKHAYRRYSTTNQDSMVVYVSTNCGTTWNRVATFKETQTVTPYVWISNSNLTTIFTPTTSADWCGVTNYSSCKTINLTPYVGNTIKIKFENISGYGNNLYLDDINVTGVSSLPAPVADFTVSSTTPCTGTTVTFTDITTNTPSSWSWVFTPATVTFLNGTTATSQNPVVSFNATGNYTVALTAANTQTNNTKTKTNYISVSASSTPTITIASADTNICSGTTASFTSINTFGGTTPSYQWKINGTNVGTNSSSFSSTTLNNNDTVYCLLTSNASCVSPATVTSNKFVIKVTTASTPAISISTNDTNICSGVNASFISAILNGGSTPMYQWKVNGVNVGTNISTFSSTTLNNNDTVYCMLTSNAKCVSPTSIISNKKLIKVNIKPIVTLTLNTHTLCNFDTTITLNGGNPSGGNYSGTGVTTNQFKPLVSGVGLFTITYSYTNVSGCSNTATDQITVNAIPSVPSITRINNTLTCSLTGVTYTWLLNNVPINGATNQTYDILQSGTYKVVVKNANGCINISSDFIAYKTGIKEISGVSGVKIFPNPVNEILSVEFTTSKKKNIHFTVYDVSGKKVLEETKSFEEGENSHQLSFSNFAKGAYLIEMNDGHSMIQKSVVKE